MANGQARSQGSVREVEALEIEQDEKIYDGLLEALEKIVSLDPGLWKTAQRIARQSIAKAKEVKNGNIKRVGSRQDTH